MHRMVNCFQRQDHRTNNDVEGFHSKILHEFPVLNPDLWKLITTIQKIDYDHPLETARTAPLQLQQLVISAPAGQICPRI